jgi:hypothetical protein
MQTTGRQDWDFGVLTPLHYAASKFGQLYAKCNPGQKCTF